MILSQRSSHRSSTLPKNQQNHSTSKVNLSHRHLLQQQSSKEKEHQHSATVDLRKLLQNQNVMQVAKEKGRFVPIDDSIDKKNADKSANIIANRH